MLNRYSIFIALLLSNSFLSFLAERSRKELINKEAEVQHLDQPTKHKAVDPSQVTELSWQPRVFHYKNFLSEDESEHLISLALKQKTNSVTSDNLKKADMVKLSSDVVFPLNTEDEIVARIEEKISAWTFIPKDNGTPLQVLHFGREESKGSLNYFGNQSGTFHGNPLMAGVFLYLSNVSRGGQILFPKSGKKSLSDCRESSNTLRPIKGNAVVFFNVHLNASLDSSSSHARCPVLEGEMWCAIKLLHLRTVREKESAVLNGGVCTDEDDECPRWAAIGECERNPVFMIGSPDYYGTCRKSCNICR